MGRLLSYTNEVENMVKKPPYIDHSLQADHFFEYVPNPSAFNGDYHLALFKILIKLKIVTNKQ